MESIIYKSIKIALFFIHRYIFGISDGSIICIFFFNKYHVWMQR